MNIVQKSLNFSSFDAKCTYRMATAQGKQGIWMLTFPDRENTGNLVNVIFLHRENCGNTWYFLNF